MEKSGKLGRILKPLIRACEEKDEEKLHSIILSFTEKDVELLKDFGKALVGFYDDLQPHFEKYHQNSKK